LQVTGKTARVEREQATIERMEAVQAR
jgi:hypothetical protein